jgi:hypothetical protein
MSSRIRETLPVRCTREELIELRKTHELVEHHDRIWIIVTVNGERRLAPLNVIGAADIGHVGAPPEVTVNDQDEVAIELDLDGPPTPRPPTTNVAEMLLSVKEAEAYLDARMLNWCTIPANPPSVLAGGKLAYSQADLDAWIEHWRNAFVTVDDLLLGPNAEPMTEL